MNSLNELCHHYWPAIYAVARHMGNDRESAKDLTQGFFENLLSKNWLADAKQEKGRFRAFLITAFKRYAIHEWQRERTVKRGAQFTFVSLDEKVLDQLHGIAGQWERTPEQCFDRRWALTLLDRALKRLVTEYEHFSVMKDSLTADRGEIEYSEIAAKLGLSEGAARVVIHRFRKRYRELIREEVCCTVVNPHDVDDEMRDLMRALL